MEYTERGMKLGLDELESILQHAKFMAMKGMEACIYIEGGDKPRIYQYEQKDKEGRDPAWKLIYGSTWKAAEFGRQ